MADNNKKEPFHWNFDLKNTDSDFTDIEYAPDQAEEAEEGGDIKPFIFVDGNYNSDTDSSAFSQDSAFRAGAGSLPEEDEEDDYEDKKKKKSSEKKLSASSVFGNNSIPWKKILIVAAVLLLIVLAVILLWPKGEKDPGGNTQEKKWTKSDDATIKVLVDNYFIALKEGNATLMSNVLASTEEFDELLLVYQSKICEDFTNVTVYSYPGTAEGEYCLTALADIKYVYIDTPAPKYFFFYARPEADTGKLRLIVMDDDSSAEYKYFASIYGESKDIQSVVKDVNDRYGAALRSDEKLAYYDSVWAEENGLYVIPKEGPIEHPVNSSTEVPPESTATPPETTASPVITGEIAVSATGWIADGPLRLRSTPSTDNNENVLIHLYKYHYVRIVGQLDGWYHIVDDLTENGIGGTQEPTGLEGYISSEFVTQNYANIPND